MELIDSAITEAKKVKSIDTWDDMVYATNLVNKLAGDESAMAVKQFERLTTLLATCTVTA